MDNEEKIELLEKMGTAIYGSHWKPALASHLGINDRSVRQWASGERAIPDSIIREILSLMHDRANLLARTADMVSREIRKMPECERIIYQTNLKLPEIRRELYTEKRDWFDIDGRLYALNENGSVIDIHGYESDCYGMSVLPDGVTVNDMLIAKNKYIAENGDYD